MICRMFGNSKPASGEMIPVE